MSFAVAAPPPPTVRILRAPSGTVTNGEATVAFDSPEGATTFLCAVDSGPHVRCASPFTTQLSVGTHDIAVQVDAVGAEATSVAVVVAPPTARITSAPPGTTSGDVSFSFTSDDSTAAYSCRVDTAPWAACVSPAAFTLTTGSHVLAVHATDAATGTGPDASTAPFTVATGPTVVLDTNLPRTTTSSHVVVAFHSSDPTATFACRLNRGTWSPCTSPTAFDLPPGSSVVQIRATSADGIVGPVATTGAVAVKP